MRKAVTIGILAGFLLACPNLHAGELNASLRGAVGQKFDDNITYAEKDPQSDFISRLSAGLKLEYETGRTRASLDTDVAREIFFDTPGNNNTSEYVTMNLSHVMTKQDTITVSDQFSYTYDPQDYEEEFSKGGGRNSYYRNRLDIAYDRDLSSDAYLRLGYGHDLDISRASSLLDSTVNRSFLEGGYSFSPKLLALGRYDVLNRRFDEGGSATIQTLSAGLRHYWTKQLSLEGRVGTDLIDSYNGDNLAEPVWMLTLRDRISETETAELSVSQRYSTNPYNSDVFHSWRVSGELNTYLSERLSVNAEAFYGRGEYDSLDIKDDLLGGKIGFSYDIREDVKGVASYSFSETQSNVTAREYQKNTVFLGIKTRFF